MRAWWQRTLPDIDSSQEKEQHFWSLDYAELKELTEVRLLSHASLFLMKSNLTFPDALDSHAGVSASRYAYLGGFDGTSNLEAGRQFGIPCKGTHAHSFVQAHIGFEDIADSTLNLPDGGLCPDFIKLVLRV
jgi:nicotinate phosphoribosyltransferase